MHTISERLWGLYTFGKIRHRNSIYIQVFFPLKQSILLNYYEVYLEKILSLHTS